MYSIYPGLILGFHGRDEATGKAIIAGRESLRPSENDYDWLGNGFYFWEFNHDRAVSFASERAQDSLGSSKINTPFVLGAVIDLGYCWNLLDEGGLAQLREGYETLKAGYEPLDFDIPENSSDSSMLLRRLDCAVIEMVHWVNEMPGKREFDSVRGAFIEGSPVFPGAGVREKNHIQICIRNPNCIKGFFQPRTLDPDFPRPNAT